MSEEKELQDFITKIKNYIKPEFYNATHAENYMKKLLSQAVDYLTKEES